MYTNDRRTCLPFTPRYTVMTCLRTGLIRAVLFALIWWILTDGVMASWLVGVPVVLSSTIVSMTLLPPFSWSLIGIMRTVPFFLWHSLCGAVDVARRAFHPALPISPGLYYYQWHLPAGLPQIFMANMVSLLPGTLSAELADEYLCVHVLDQTGAFTSDLSILEEYVTQLFGLNLTVVKSKKI